MKYSNDDIHKQLNTALYIRLSKEDGDKEESNSIGHQRSILQEFVKRHPELQIYDEYIDDGYSGTNFKRPGFERMLEDIKAGEIGCVLVKDLSRFARNHIMAGLYIERYFPEWEIRFVSIGENYDSQNSGDGMNDILLPIQNLFNEFHARDTSRKVQRVMKSMQKEGKCVAAFVPYGYQKNPKNKHILLVDDYASMVVKRIYRMYLEGMGILTIAKALNKEAILCPSEYKNANGSSYTNANRLQATSYWTECTVKRVLQNEVYIGTLVQGKTERTINRKPKRVPKDKWIRVPHAHEAIISPDTFEKVQALLKRNARSMKTDGKWAKFAGVLKCAECGRSLCKTEWNGAITYKCGTYKRIGIAYCTPHAIKESILSELLKADLNKILSEIQTLPQLVGSQSKEQSSNNSAKKRQRLQLDLEKCIRKKAESYDDYKEGLLSKEEFLAYGEKCDVQKQQLESQLGFLDDEKAKEKALQSNVWIKTLLERKEVDEIDREIVLDMVHEIQVYEDNTIKIIYNFSDELDHLFDDKIETIN